MCYSPLPSFLSLPSLLSTNLPSSPSLPFLKLLYPVPHLPTHPSIHYPSAIHLSILHPTTHSPIIHTSVNIIHPSTHSFPTQIHLTFVSSIYSTTYPSIHSSIHLSIHPLIHPSIHPSFHKCFLSIFSVSAYFSGSESFLDF